MLRIYLRIYREQLRESQNLELVMLKLFSFCFSSGFVASVMFSLHNLQSARHMEKTQSTINIYWINAPFLRAEIIFLLFVILHVSYMVFCTQWTSNNYKVLKMFILLSLLAFQPELGAYPFVTVLQPYGNVCVYPLPDGAS